MADYFSFKDVMNELELSEEDLKRMVSEGELRAFRDENKMKFKKEDVETLKRGRITEPTIILPTTPGGKEKEETVLDLDIDEEASALSKATAGKEEDLLQTSELSLSDSDLSLPDESEISLDADETFIEEDEQDGLSTEPVSVINEEDVIIEEVALDEDESRTVAVGRKTGRRGKLLVPAGAEEEIEARRPHWVWTSLLVAAFILTGFSGFFFYDLARLEQDTTNRPSPLTAWAANAVLDRFWSDSEYKDFHLREFPSKGTPPYEKLSGFTEANWYNGPSFEMPDPLQEEAGP